jgi:hypothetical protein
MDGNKIRMKGFFPIVCRFQLVLMRNWFEILSISFFSLENIILIILNFMALAAGCFGAKFQIVGMNCQQ